MTHPRTKPPRAKVPVLRLAAMGAWLLLGGGAGAAANFDGNWSVVIITESGSCDPAYRYRVRVENGVVHYAGDADFTISGRVDDSGAVRVSISRGQQRASGSGRLRSDTGTGTWSGDSGTDRCQGRWEAERR